MLKECSNCNAKISFSEFYKQYLINNRYKYTCNKCGAVHNVTISSRIVNTILFIILYGYLIVESTFSLPIKILVLLIYFLILQPLILRYEKKD